MRVLQMIDGLGRSGGAERSLAILAPHLQAEGIDLHVADLAGRRAAGRRHVPCVSSLVNTSYGPAEYGLGGTRRLKLRAAQAADIATARSVTRFHALTEHVAKVMSRRLLI